jgi:predicted Zn-dependent protease with MMP-like domain
MDFKFEYKGWPTDGYEFSALVSKRSNWPRGTELSGCYTGVSRTKRQHNLVQTSPELIFVFRGPILRCSKGNLPAEVKQVVRHKVAHWLGHDEGEVRNGDFHLA